MLWIWQLTEVTWDIQSYNDQDITEHCQWWIINFPMHALDQVMWVVNRIQDLQSPQLITSGDGAWNTRSNPALQIWMILTSSKLLILLKVLRFTARFTCIFSPNLFYFGLKWTYTHFLFLFIDLYPEYWMKYSFKISEANLWSLELLFKSFISEVGMHMME